jgi:4-amino-4-deoxy-L-arabinose transferase-like glycosyltransferase
MRSRLASVETLSLIAIAIAGAICYGLFLSRGLWLGTISYSISPAERVLCGQVPYRDFFFNYTPAALWLNALLMKIFGAKLAAIYVVIFAFKLATLLLLCFLAARLAGLWAGITLAALTLAWIGYRYVFYVHPAQYSVLFALLGLYCALKYDSDGRARWLLSCGLAIGVVFTFKYSVGLILIFLAAVALVIRELSWPEPNLRAGLFRAARAVAICWLGFGIVVAAMSAHLARQGAFGPMISHFLKHASDYAEERAIGLPSVRSAIPYVAALGLAVAIGHVILRRAARWFECYLLLTSTVMPAILFMPGMGWFARSATAAIFYFPPATFAATLLSLLFSLRRGSANWWAERGPVVTVALFAAGIYLEIFPRADYYHLVRALPPVFLLFLVLIRSQGSIWGRRRAALFLAAASPLIAIGVKDTWLPQFDGWLRFRDRKPLSIERARGIMVGQKEAELIECLTAMIEGHSAPGDYIFSFSRRGGAFYFLAERKNPTRFLWWDSVGIEERHREEALREISEEGPKLILIQDDMRDSRILDLIGARYRKIGSVADISVYGKER